MHELESEYTYLHRILGCLRISTVRIGQMIEIVRSTEKFLGRLKWCPIWNLKVTNFLEAQFQIPIGGGAGGVQRGESGE